MATGAQKAKAAHWNYLSTTSSIIFPDTPFITIMCNRELMQ